MKNKIYIINIINLILLLMYLSSFIFKTDVIDKNKNVEELLLIDSNEEIINIKLKNNSKNEILDLDVKNYYGKIGKVTIPFDRIKVDTFVNYLRKPLKMYKILDKFDSKNLEYSEYFGEYFFQLIINDNKFVYFGQLNDLANKIYFNILGIDVLWQIENDIFSFLTTDKSFWCDNNLCINLPTSDGVKEIKINGSKLPENKLLDVLFFLKSLQGNSLMDFIFTEAEIKNLDNIINIVIYCDNFSYYINLIKKDDKSYIQIWDEKTGLKYLKEISIWTYDRIVQKILL